MLTIATIIGRSIPKPSCSTATFSSSVSPLNASRLGMRSSMGCRAATPGCCSRAASRIARASTVAVAHSNSLLEGARGKDKKREE